MHFLYFLLDLFHFDQRTREYLDRAWSNDSVIFLLLCGKRSTNSSSLSPLIRSYSVRFVYEGKRIGDEDTAESVSVKFKKAREKWRHIWNKRKGIGPLIRPKSDLLSCSTKSLANSHVTIHEVDYDSPKSSKGRERERNLICRRFISPSPCSSHLTHLAPLTSIYTFPSYSCSLLQLDMEGEWSSWIFNRSSNHLSSCWFDTDLILFLPSLPLNALLQTKMRSMPWLSS